MKVKWLGHASFLVTSDSGVKVITDPYVAGMGINYDEIKETADVLTVSHEHPDHNNTAIPGDPKVVKGAGTTEVKGISFKGIESFHDASGGSERGPNTIFCFTVDGVRLCHLGDLGHPLSAEQAGAIGEVDVLMIPIGGVFTIDAAGASAVVAQLKPRVAIPMHYSTTKCLYPIAPVEAFTEGKENVKKASGAEVEFKAGALPAATEIVVLGHAC